MTEQPKKQTVHLYLDDSGTRNPDKITSPPGTRDWFAVGGVMINEEDEQTSRDLHAAFCARWNIDKPLHSSEIRSKSDNFAWLGTLSAADQQEFLDSLTEMLLAVPVIGIACVVDRPGYDARYRNEHGRKIWSLCKTAFTVVVERAAKRAIKQERRMRVYFERCDKKTDNRIKSYYDEMKAAGMPFDVDRMAKYQPMNPAQIAATLYELKPKMKSSPVLQLADLYLYPMALSGYQSENRAYLALKEASKLIDCHVTAEEIEKLGIKYSCFDWKKQPPK